MSCSFKMELWSLRLLYQLQKVHCGRIKDVFTVLPRELSKHRRKTSKEKKKQKKNRVSVIAAGNHEMTEVWTAILGGSDTYYPSSGSVVCTFTETSEFQQNTVCTLGFIMTIIDP